MMDISIDKIVVNDRLRALDMSKAAQIAGSILDIGLLNPITVKSVNSHYELVAGRHRLEAFRILKRDSIPAQIFDGDDLDAELAEIDENLRRSDLSILEQGEHLLRRNEILEQRGERAARGGQVGNKNASKNEGETVSPLFLATSDIAAEVGLSERSAQQRLQIARDIIPEAKEAIRNTEIADSTTQLLVLARMDAGEQKEVAKVIADGCEDVRTARHEAQRILLKQERENLAEIGKSVDMSGEWRVYNADFREFECGIVDAIITDPPYPREYLSLYGDLAEYSKRVVAPGGVIAVMVGQSYIPEILSIMTPHINYRWMLAYLTPGGQAAQIWDRNINTFWKPVIIFSNGDICGDWIGDVCKSNTNDNDKRFHGWGQSESGMLDIVDRLTKPGQKILDPFCGAGTTGVVCVTTGRKFIGIDIDKDTANVASGRISQCLK